jgi:hypothetical protein
LFENILKLNKMTESKDTIGVGGREISKPQFWTIAIFVLFNLSIVCKKQLF